MALTPFRWIALALIGCLLTVILALDFLDRNALFGYRYFDTAGQDAVENRMRDELSRLTYRSSNLAARYRALEVLDSVKRMAARAPDTGAMRLFVSAGYSPDERTAIDWMLRHARASRPAGAGRMDVFIGRDTVHNVRGVERWPGVAEVRYMLPNDKSSRCTVVVRTGRNEKAVRNALYSSFAAEQLFGPCGYYATFGDPGPHIREWLMNGAWLYAGEGSWTTPTLLGTLPDSYGRIFYGPSPALDALDVRGGGVGCIKGDASECERVVMERVTQYRAVRVGGATFAASLGYRRYNSSTALGERGGEFLADAVHDLGRDRFAKFWTSPDPVPAAFQNAAGESMASYTRRWLVTHYGEIKAGPRVPWDSLATAMLLVIAGVAFTMIMSLKRTFS